MLYFIRKYLKYEVIFLVFLYKSNENNLDFLNRNAIYRIDYIIIRFRVPIYKDFKGIHNIKISLWLYLLILLAETELCLYSIVKTSYFSWFNPIRHCT